MDARAKIRSGKKLVKRTCGNDTRMATSGTTQHHAATIQLLLVATVLLGPLTGMTFYAPRPRRYVSPFPLASLRADIRPLQKQVHPDQLTGTKPSRPASPRRKALHLFVFTSEKARYVFKHDGVQYLLEASPYVARLRSKIDRGFETNSMSGR